MRKKNGGNVANDDKYCITFGNYHNFRDVDMTPPEQSNISTSKSPAPRAKARVKVVKLYCTQCGVVRPLE